MILSLLKNLNTVFQSRVLFPKPQLCHLSLKTSVCMSRTSRLRPLFLAVFPLCCHSFNLRCNVTLLNTH